MPHLPHGFCGLSSFRVIFQQGALVIEDFTMGIVVE
jgi:hypothetical protein